MTERAGKIIFALMLATGVLTGCSQADESADAARATPSVRTVPINLYTHCGIDDARIGSTYYEAVTPLSDGNGNPPKGWDNPFHSGTMTLKNETEAVFTDDAGHEVEFRVRPGATAGKRICS